MPTMTEENEGDFDMDSTVYCTDLMGDAGQIHDPVTGWDERDQRSAASAPTGGAGRPLGRMFGRKNKNKTKGKGKSAKSASAAAAIALAYNESDDDEEEDEEDVQDANDNAALSEIDSATVQTKTDVFLSYAVSEIDDGMSTIAPMEEANGGQPVAAAATAAISSSANETASDSEDSTVSDSSKSDSLRSSNICDSTNNSSSVIASSLAPSSKNNNDDGTTPKWAMEDDDESSLTEVPTSHHPAKAKHSSSSSKKSSSNNNTKNKCWTFIAVSMLLVGITAVVLGVLYGMGLIDLDGSGQGAKSGAEAQACARVGLCGGGGSTSTSTNTDNTKQEQEQPIPMDIVPTDRPTAPPITSDMGVCAAHEEKSRSCGANNPSHPARCCPGLYCDNKYCIDPNPQPKEEEQKETTEDVAVTPEPTPPVTEEPTQEPTPPPNTPEPTSHPTTAFPTKPPTPNIWISQPTGDQAAQGIVPPPGHFTYDPDDAQYGPSAWTNPQYSATTSVTLNGKTLRATDEYSDLGAMKPEDLDSLEVIPADQASAEYKFWSRHAWSIDPDKKRDFTENVCDGTDSRAEQSPIDVYVQSGDIDETGEETGVPGGLVEPRCEEHHEIRIKPGQFPVESTKIKKQILPSQLRLVYPDPQFEADGETLLPDSKLPQADFPHGWGGNMEALRVDVKIPSEHWLNGKEYAGEYQIYHLHHKKKKAPVISIMIDIHPQDKPNQHFQLALNEWQKVWEKDYLECELRKRKERKLDAGLFEAVRGWLGGSGDEDYSTWLDEPASEDTKFRRRLRAARRAQEESSAFWDPYKKDEIMRSIHFLGYSGSLTEPPCTEFIEWRILDTPMLISRQQLFQMKNLLFRHRSVESGCQMSSNHHMGSVARRPLQPLNRRKVYRCTCRDFLADDDRDAILALDGMTADNATYTPKCNKREFRNSEKTKPWLLGIQGDEGV